MKSKKKNSEKSQKAESKKKYEAPKLSRHGGLQELTASTLLGSADSKTMQT